MLCRIECSVYTVILCRHIKLDSATTLRQGWHRGCTTHVITLCLTLRRDPHLVQCSVVIVWKVLQSFFTRGLTFSFSTGAHKVHSWYCFRSHDEEIQVRLSEGQGTTVQTFLKEPLHSKDIDSP